MQEYIDTLIKTTKEMTEPIQILPQSDLGHKGTALTSSEEIIEKSEQNFIEMTKPTKISTHPLDLETSLDDLIDKGLGNFGRTQLLQSLLVSMAMFFDAQQSFISVYTDGHPPWHCTSNNHHTKYYCSSKDSDDICKLSRSAWSWNGPSSTTIISQWGLECVSPFIIGLPQSSFFMGCFVAGFLIATFGDSSLGRKKMLFLSCLTMSIASIIIIFSTNIWVYSALKFVIGFCRSSVGTCSMVLLTERASKEWRFRVGVFQYIWYTLGFLSLPGIAYINRDSPWKSLYLWISIPGICYSIFAYTFVTESPRWLLMQGKENEAMILLKASGATLTLGQLTKLARQDTSTSNLYLSSIKQLFVKRWAFKRLISILMLGFGIGMVYYGVPLSVGNLGFNLYLSVLFYALLETLSFMTTYFLHNYRRKPSLLAFSIASGICCLICAVVGNKRHIVKLVLTLVSFFNIATSFDVFLIYVVELFPTSVRNTTTSMARQAVVFGAIFSPFLISAGRKNDLFSFGIFGVIILCTASSLLFLSETKGIALCDTMDEQERKEIINV